jgi:hypothetical protein
MENVLFARRRGREGREREVGHMTSYGLVFPKPNFHPAWNRRS